MLFFTLTITQNILFKFFLILRSTVEIINIDPDDAEDEIDYDNFITNLPKKQIISYQGDSYKISDLEKCRANLIDSLYDVIDWEDDDSLKSRALYLEKNLKRKLGILTNDVIEYFVGSHEQEDEKCLQLHENLRHSCSEKNLNFCQRDVEICNYLKETGTSTSMQSYICDMCSYLTNSRVEIKNHLKQNKHLSASVYVSQNEKTTTVFQLSRCKLKNTASFDRAVFCPKCYFYFGSNVLACCLHYKYLHKPSSLNVLIYSISIDVALKTVEFEINKEYKCIDCELVFDKLKEFSKHTIEMKHHLWPENDNQVNVFFCPDNNCEFTSIDYPSLRHHISSHQDLYRTLRKSNTNKNAKLIAKMKTFDKPRDYFHIKYFSDDYLFEQVDEVSCIESSLNSLKLHPIHKKFINRLEERKKKLKKLLRFSR